MTLLIPSWRRLRTLLGGLFLFVFVLSLLRPISAAAAGKGKYLVYIGTYTDHGSKGIYAYRFDATTGQSTALGLAAESAQPSFLAADAGGHFLYAINETETYAGQPTGAVSAFAIDSASGKLSLLNQVFPHSQRWPPWRSLGLRAEPRRGHGHGTARAGSRPCVCLIVGQSFRPGRRPRARSGIRLSF